MDIEKIREFLYDLDIIRSDGDAVHNLILTYIGMSKNKSVGTIKVMIEIGVLDDDELRILTTVEGDTVATWFNISGTDADKERLVRKEGNCILDTKI